MFLLFLFFSFLPFRCFFLFLFLSFLLTKDKDKKKNETLYSVYKECADPRKSLHQL